MSEKLLVVIDNDKFNELNAKIDKLQALVEKLLSEKNNIAGYLTQQETEKLTGLSYSTIYKLRKSGELPFTSFGTRDIYYKRSDIEELLKKNEKQL
jgi:excisionase family DNA binding protein